MSTIGQICAMCDEHPLTVGERVRILDCDPDDADFAFRATIENIDHGFAKLRDDDGNCWSAALQFLVRAETTGEAE